MKEHVSTWMKELQEEEDNDAAEYKDKDNDAAESKDKRERVCVKLPTDEELGKAVSRDWAELELKLGDLDPDSEQGKEMVAKSARDIARAEQVFDLYVDILVPAVAGCYGPAAFPVTIRCYDNISTCKVANSETALRITAGSEAFARVMYQNCLKKWNKMHEHRNFKKLKTKFPRYSKRTNANPDWLGATVH
jgi:hypothetical protein